MASVHCAFVVHVTALGLHRVLDVALWPRKQKVDLAATYRLLDQCGVKAAAWSALRWVELAAGPAEAPELKELRDRLAPGAARRAYLNLWLRIDLPARLRSAHWLRLIGFSALLHDAPAGVLATFVGWRRARSELSRDLARVTDGTRPGL